MDQKWEGIVFRGFIGIVAILGSMAALGGLYFIAVPEGNKDPLLLAIGIILGWGSSVISSEYGATSTGRKVVDSAVRNIERQAITADANAQLTSGEPTPVEVVNTPDNPANVQETKT